MTMNFFKILRVNVRISEIFHRFRCNKTSAQQTIEILKDFPKVHILQKFVTLMAR